MLSLSFSFLFKNKELQTKLLGAEKSHRNPLCKIKKESSYDREYKKVNTLRENERERERASFFYTIDRYVDIDCIYYAGKNKVLKPYTFPFTPLSTITLLLHSSIIHREPERVWH